jgi:hypothetical protein
MHARNANAWKRLNAIWELQENWMKPLGKDHSATWYKSYNVDALTRACYKVKYPIMDHLRW